MKAIVKTKPEPGIDIVDMDVPNVGDNDILVKVTAGSLCGSDVHMYEWTAGYEWVPMPIIPGHEFAGEVMEFGGQVRGMSKGDRITALPGYSCGECPACITGRPAACEKMHVLGLMSDGAFSEYMTIKQTADIFKIPDNVSDEMASLTEPLAVCMQGIDLSGIKPGQTAAVFGPGPIGLLTIQLLKTAGAGLIIATGTSADENRLEIAKQIGADVTINIDKDDPVKKVKEIAGSLDFVFEATGIASTINQGLQIARRGGKVMVIGIHKDHASFDTIDLVRQQKSLIGVYAYDKNTWRRCLKLMSSGKLDPTPIITHRMPFSQGEQGFELAANKTAAKVVFVPEA
jgi:L-iditol 2-dehydrogenase